MNAYLTCDRIEERRWVNQHIQDEKDKWIDDRAQELISMFPDKPFVFARITTKTKVVSLRKNTSSNLKVKLYVSSSTE
ncbi:host nuclease inhibitor GamL [Escherichia coli O157:H7]|nr:host nuclease inhibitor GamL [Escherichia coli O157:H7]